MNNRIYFSIYALFFCFVPLSLFSMHNAVLSGAKVLGFGLAGYSTWNTVSGLIERDYSIKRDNIQEMPEEAQVWVKKVLKKNNISNIDSFEFKTSSDERGWCVTKKYVIASLSDIEALVESLHVVEKNDADRPDELLKAQKIIAENRFCLKHEVGHLVYGDVKNYLLSFAAIPFATYAAYFGATSSISWLCKMKSPRTLLQTGLYSFIAVAASYPLSLLNKRLLNSNILVSYAKYQEQRADRYACERAEDRLELESGRNHFLSPIVKWAFFPECEADQVTEEGLDFLRNNKEFRVAFNESDPMHPYPIDRADMIEKYIKDWDKNHKSL